MRGPRRDSLGAWTRFTRGPLRTIADHCVPLRVQIFDDFLTSSWCPISFDFGVKLALTWPPTWPPNPSQNLSKSRQKPIPNRILFLICFLIDFSSSFSSIFDPKINQKSIKNQSQHQPKSQIAKISKIYKKKSLKIASGPPYLLLDSFFRA